MTKIRKGQASAPPSRAILGKRFMAAYLDPAFGAAKAVATRLEAIAREGYHEYRKAPLIRKAGPGFADPEYDASAEWLARAKG